MIAIICNKLFTTHKEYNHSLAKIRGNLAIGKNRARRHYARLWPREQWEYFPNHRTIDLKGHNLKATGFREIFPFTSAYFRSGPKGSLHSSSSILQRQLKRICLVQIISRTVDHTGWTSMPSRATKQICFPCIWWCSVCFFHRCPFSKKPLEYIW